MCVFYFGIALLIYDRTNGLVTIPDFENINESFSFRKELLSQPKHPSYNNCLQDYTYIDRLLANRLNLGLGNKDIISYDATKTRAALEGYNVSTM